MRELISPWGIQGVPNRSSPARHPTWPRGKHEGLGLSWGVDFDTHWMSDSEQEVSSGMGKVNAVWNKEENSGVLETRQ